MQVLGKVLHSLQEPYNAQRILSLGIRWMLLQMTGQGFGGLRESAIGQVTLDERRGRRVGSLRAVACTNPETM